MQIDDVSKIFLLLLMLPLLLEILYSSPQFVCLCVRACVLCLTEEPLWVN
jgi:hypothetical protein